VCIPAESVHWFRTKPSSDSGAKRPPIPEQSVHRFRAFRPAIPAESVHPSEEADAG
jgi:hypothetical protein